jgi:hypothetical protein
MRWSFLRREKQSAKSFCIGRLRSPPVSALENFVCVESRLWLDASLPSRRGGVI